MPKLTSKTLQTNSVTDMTSVCVHPESIQFFEDDPNTHSQILTLFNPFDHSIKFKILSTAPNKYIISQPTGNLNAKASIELVIKHLSSTFNPKQNLTEKLRIQIYQIHRLNNQIINLIAKRDLTLNSISQRDQFALNSMPTSQFSQFNQENSGDIMNVEKYSSFSHGNSLNAMVALNSNSSRKMLLSKSKTNQSGKNLYEVPPARTENENVNYLVILIGIICLLILFLPTISQTENQSNVGTKLSSYLHATYEIKLFVSFVLGMVTMVILRT